MGFVNKVMDNLPQIAGDLDEFDAFLIGAGEIFEDEVGMDQEFTNCLFSGSDVDIEIIEILQAFQDAVSNEKIETGVQGLGGLLVTAKNCELL